MAMMLMVIVGGGSSQTAAAAARPLRSNLIQSNPLTKFRRGDFTAWAVTSPPYPAAAAASNQPTRRKQANPLLPGLSVRPFAWVGGCRCVSTRYNNKSIGATVEFLLSDRTVMNTCRYSTGCSPSRWIPSSSSCLIITRDNFRVGDDHNRQQSSLSRPVMTASLSRESPKTRPARASVCVWSKEDLSHHVSSSSSP
jgi:hypothetical protein